MSTPSKKPDTPISCLSTPSLAYGPEASVEDVSACPKEWKTVDPPTPLEPPNGGARAWTVVFGAFLILFAQLGFVNSFGTFQEYYQHHQLASRSNSAISWIGAIQIFLQLFCVTAPLFPSQ